MGRKDKKVPTERQEACHKLNFLHQASHAVLAINPENVEMSRFYASTLKEIAQKLVYKLDPNIKRTTCKHCHALLVPGVTAKIRIRRKRERHLVVTCLGCNTLRRYLCRAGHVLWSEQNASISGNKQTNEDNKDTIEEKVNQQQETMAKKRAEQLS